MKRLIDAGKYTATVLHDNHDGKLHVENRFDCEPALIAAAEAREIAPNPKSSFKKIATVPMWLIHRSIVEGWYNDMAKWRRILDEYSKFKVHKDW